MISSRLDKYNMIHRPNHKQNKFKEAYLEGMAYGIWKTLIKLDVIDGHCKHYDPLDFRSVDEDGFIEFASYVFNFKNGGRGHKYDSYEEIFEDLLEEISKIKEMVEE